MDRREARRMDLFAQIAVASVQQALDQARLTIDDSNRDDIGVILGSGIGGLRSMDQGYYDYFHKGPGRVNPLTSALMIANMAAGNTAIVLGVRGPNFCVASACATGNHAIGEAFETIRRGDAPVIIAGGTDAALTPLCLSAFHRTGALSTRNDDPQHASRPFDAQRDGFVFGEGAAALILERLDHALARGATPLAEIIGYGASADAFHVTAPDENGYGAILSMRRALKKASLQPSDVDYINAHGTSTPLNDKTETLAIKTLFGEHAYGLPISSTKSMTGHLIGAAGAVEAIACIQTLLTGWIHPTINYEEPDPDCDLDYVPNRPRQADVRIALSNSFGFGGHNATLIFKKYEGV
jgi:3-oxoacyl-[acyl-carrier-protein] synthase II